MKRLTLIIISILLLCSCSTERMLDRRIKRVEKFAMTTGQTINDTIVAIDTVEIVVPEYHTSVLTEFHTDTIVEVVNNDRVSVKYLYDDASNTIEHTVEIKEVIKEVIVEIPVEVERIVVQENKWPSPMWMLLLIIFPVIWIKRNFFRDFPWRARRY